jgi:ribosomal protein S18 acetylase RimI-like enzyme
MPRMNERLRRALEVNHHLLALGNRRFEADGGVFVSNPSIAQVYDANHVARVTASTPGEIDALFSRADREFAHLPYRRFDVDPLTPPGLEARLAHEGYTANDMLVMVLEGDLRGAAPRPFEIRLVEGDAGWDAYGALHRIDWSEYAAKQSDPEERWVADAMLQNRRIKSPPARYWLAYIDGRPASYLLSWEGTEGVGQIEDLMTHPELRHRGLATALIHHCVADCRKQGAGPVIIVASPDDTPKRMYAALGFRPLCIKRNYLKTLGSPAAIST